MLAFLSVPFSKPIYTSFLFLFSQNNNIEQSQISKDTESFNYFLIG